MCCEDSFQWIELVAFCVSVGFTGFNVISMGFRIPLGRWSYQIGLLVGSLLVVVKSFVVFLTLPAFDDSESEEAAAYELISIWLSSLFMSVVVLWFARVWYAHGEKPSWVGRHLGFLYGLLVTSLTVVMCALGITFLLVESLGSLTAWHNLLRGALILSTLLTIILGGIFVWRVAFRLSALQLDEPTFDSIQKAKMMFFVLLAMMGSVVVVVSLDFRFSEPTIDVTSMRRTGTLVWVLGLEVVPPVIISYIFSPEKPMGRLFLTPTGVYAAVQTNTNVSAHEPEPGPELERAA